MKNKKNVKKTNHRKYQGESYLFGFQGMEQEPDQDETQYHTLFRQYDAVLGRWWSSDPEQNLYASYSPYNAYAGNPVNYVDPDGRILRDKNGKIIFTPQGYGYFKH